MKLSKDRWNQCPVRFFAGLVGDKWRLLIIRDLMFRGKRNFNALKQSGEGISTNILADRLKNLEADGIIESKQDKQDGREKSYSLTEKGWDLLPTMQAIFEWSYKHDRQTYLNETNERYFRGDIETLKNHYRGGQTLVLDRDKQER